MTSGSPLRTRLARVKGLGAAHRGVSHWWWQRVTALALIPLSLWFVASLVSALLLPDVMKVAQWFASPVNALLMIALLAALFLHAKLGVQVIIEDYVHSPVMKYTLLLLNMFICFAFAAVCILAVLKLHMIDVGAGA
ncbi:MAG: succinate dehydrogenase, hydrophobic membrane anchor protein [Pseudomonadota bacterium]|nr:succinate dehydrogenase, hydrophobic membrane anchor protein [Pseudomonadota bacterium]MDE3037883.1 succinate dehydrogenase, hydrophobic membrane anchor protein [Pseudomonadota bacterium]